MLSFQTLPPLLDAVAMNLSAMNAKIDSIENGALYMLIRKSRTRGCLTAARQLGYCLFSWPPPSPEVYSEFGRPLTLLDRIGWEVAILLVQFQGLRVCHCPADIYFAAIHDVLDVDLALFPVGCQWDVFNLKDATWDVTWGAALAYSRPDVALNLCGEGFPRLHLDEE